MREVWAPTVWGPLLLKRSTTTVIWRQIYANRDTQKWKEVNWHIFMECSYYLFLCACRVAEGLLTAYRRKEITLTWGKKTLPWSMMPLTYNSFHATVLSGQNWNSIYNVFGKLFFSLCFNISREKELCFPGQPLLKWIHLLLVCSNYWALIHSLAHKPQGIPITS